MSPLAILPSLVTITTALRILEAVLALSSLVWWSPAVARIFLARAQPGDWWRAPWWPLALAVLLFEVRYFLASLDSVARDRLALGAHGGMASALLFAVYLHGHAQVDGFRVRRALAVHLGMLGLCIGAAALVR